MVAVSYTADDPEARLAHFDFAFEHAPIGIALIDLEGRIIRRLSLSITRPYPPLKRPSAWWMLQICFIAQGLGSLCRQF